jgi:hypothetical protein
MARSEPAGCDSLARAMQCPLCQTELPEGAKECTRCDWVQPATHEPTHHDDWIAAILSFVPGLGHVYKGHLAPGFLLLCLLGPLYLLVVFWLIPKTYGASLLLPGIFVLLTGYHAYHLRKVPRSESEELAMNTLRHWLSWRPGTKK